MIIPTADFDPMFAEDGTPFRARMIDYIRREFGDILGCHANLLKLPNGIELLAQIYVPGDQESTRKAA